MFWTFLLVAAVFEIMWTIGLKQISLAPRPPLIAATGIAMAASLGLLGLAVRGIPLGTAYAVWTGIGTLGSVIFGILLFGESANWPRLICLLLILVGVAGLKLNHS
jgi:quaternary ammonium compound-resistance protein SugE